MSEKRFTIHELVHYDEEQEKWVDCDRYCITDNERHINYDLKFDERQLCELLNEQQATITQLEKVNGKNFAKRRLLEQDNLVLRNENEQLKEELNNLKKDETMLYHYYTLARYGGDGV